MLPEHAVPEPMIIADGNGFTVTTNDASEVHPDALVPETLTMPFADPHNTVTVVAVVPVITPLVTVKVLVAPPLAVYVCVEFWQAVALPVSAIAGAAFTVTLVLALPLQVVPFNETVTATFIVVAPEFGVAVIVFGLAPALKLPLVTVHA